MTDENIKQDDAKYGHADAQQYGKQHAARNVSSGIREAAYATAATTAVSTAANDATVSTNGGPPAAAYYSFRISTVAAKLCQELSQGPLAALHQHAFPTTGPWRGGRKGLGRLPQTRNRLPAATA